MAFPYRKILCPVDFDDNSVRALEEAALLAKGAGAKLHVLHVVPMVILPVGSPVYIDIFKSQEDAAREQLKELARAHLGGVDHELAVELGDPASAIIGAEKRLGVDLVVMATHGRTGFARFFLGSVAEMVLRESVCAVLTVRYERRDRHLVRGWMSRNPLTAHPEEKVAAVATRMRAGRVLSMPVVHGTHLAGMVSEFEIREIKGAPEDVEVRSIMVENPPKVDPTTAVEEAGRVLVEKKVQSLPVVDNGNLVGIISLRHILHALVEAA